MAVISRTHFSQDFAVARPVRDPRANWINVRLDSALSWLSRQKSWI